MKKLLLFIALIISAISIAMDNQDELLDSFLGPAVYQNNIYLGEPDESSLLTLPQTPQPNTPSLFSQAIQQPGTPSLTASTPQPGTPSLTIPRTPQAGTPILRELKREPATPSQLQIPSSPQLTLSPATRRISTPTALNTTALLLSQQRSNNRQPQAISWQEIKERRYSMQSAQNNPIVAADLESLKFMVERNYQNTNTNIEEMFKAYERSIIKDLQPKCCVCGKKDFQKTYTTFEVKKILLEHYRVEHNATTTSFLTTFDGSPELYIEKTSVIDLTEVPEEESSNVSTTIPNEQNINNTTQNLAITPQQLQQTIRNIQSAANQQQRSTSNNYINPYTAFNTTIPYNQPIIPVTALPSHTTATSTNPPKQSKKRKVIEIDSEEDNFNFYEVDDELDSDYETPKKKKATRKAPQSKKARKLTDHARVAVNNPLIVPAIPNVQPTSAATPVIQAAIANDEILRQALELETPQQRIITTNNNNAVSESNFIQESQLPATDIGSPVQQNQDSRQDSFEPVVNNNNSWEEIKQRKVSIKCSQDHTISTNRLVELKSRFKEHLHSELDQEILDKYDKSLIKDLQPICPTCGRKDFTKTFTISDAKKTLRQHFDSIHKNKKDFFGTDFDESIEKYIQRTQIATPATGLAANKDTQAESLSNTTPVQQETPANTYSSINSETHNNALQQRELETTAQESINEKENNSQVRTVNYYEDSSENDDPSLITNTTNIPATKPNLALNAPPQLVLMQQPSEQAEKDTIAIEANPIQEVMSDYENYQKQKGISKKDSSKKRKITNKEQVEDEYYNSNEVNWKEIKDRQYLLPCPVQNCNYSLKAKSKSEFLEKFYDHIERKHTEIDELPDINQYISSKYYENIVGICPVEGCPFKTDYCYDSLDPANQVDEHVNKEHKYNRIFTRETIRVVKPNAINAQNSANLNNDDYSPAALPEGNRSDDENTPLAVNNNQSPANGLDVWQSIPLAQAVTPANAIDNTQSNNSTNQVETITLLDSNTEPQQEFKKPTKKRKRNEVENLSANKVADNNQLTENLDNAQPDATNQLADNQVNKQSDDTVTQQKKTKIRRVSNNEVLQLNKDKTITTRSKSINKKNTSTQKTKKTVTKKKAKPVRTVDEDVTLESEPEEPSQNNEQTTTTNHPSNESALLNEIKKRTYSLNCAQCNQTVNTNSLSEFTTAYFAHIHNALDLLKFSTYDKTLKKDLQLYCPLCSKTIGTSYYYTLRDIEEAGKDHYSVEHKDNLDAFSNAFALNPSQFIPDLSSQENNNTVTNTYQKKSAQKRKLPASKQTPNKKRKTNNEENEAIPMATNQQEPEIEPTALPEGIRTPDDSNEQNTVTNNTILEEATQAPVAKKSKKKTTKKVNSRASEPNNADNTSITEPEPTSADNQVSENNNNVVNETSQNTSETNNNNVTWDDIKKRAFAVECSEKHLVDATNITYFTELYNKHHIHNAKKDNEILKNYLANKKPDLQPFCSNCKKNQGSRYYLLSEARGIVRRHIQYAHSDELDSFHEKFSSNPEHYVYIPNGLNSELFIKAQEELREEENEFEDMETSKILLAGPIGERKHHIECSKGHELNMKNWQAIKARYKPHAEHDSDKKRLANYEKSLKNIADLRSYCPLCKNIWSKKYFYTPDDVKSNVKDHYKIHHKTENPSEQFDANPENFTRIKKKDRSNEVITTTSTANQLNETQTNNNNNPNNAVNWEPIKKRTHKITCSKGHTLENSRLRDMVEGFKNAHLHDETDDERLEKYKKNNFDKSDLVAYCPLCKKTLHMEKRQYTVQEIQQSLQGHYTNIHKIDYPHQDFDANPSNYIRIKKTTANNNDRNIENEVIENTTTTNAPEVSQENTELNPIWSEIKNRSHSITCSENHTIERKNFNDLKSSFKPHLHKNSDSETLKQYEEQLTKNLQGICKLCPFFSEYYYTLADVRRSLAQHYSEKHKKALTDDFYKNPQRYVEIKDAPIDPAEKEKQILISHDSSSSKTTTTTTKKKDSTKSSDNTKDRSTRKRKVNYKEDSSEDEKSDNESNEEDYSKSDNDDSSESSSSDSDSSSSNSSSSSNNDSSKATPTNKTDAPKNDELAKKPADKETSVEKETELNTQISPQDNEKQADNITTQDNNPFISTMNEPIEVTGREETPDESMGVDIGGYRSSEEENNAIITSDNAEKDKNDTGQEINVEQNKTLITQPEFTTTATASETKTNDENLHPTKTVEKQQPKAKKSTTTKAKVVKQKSVPKKNNNKDNSPELLTNNPHNNNAVTTNNSANTQSDVANNNNATQNIDWDAIKKRSYSITCSLGHTLNPATLKDLKKGFNHHLHSKEDKQRMQEITNNDLQPYCPSCKKHFSMKNYYTLAEVKNSLSEHYRNNHEAEEQQNLLRDFDSGVEKYTHVLTTENKTAETLLWEQIKSRKHTIKCSDGKTIEAKKLDYFKGKYLKKQGNTEKSKKKFADYEKSLKKDLKPKCPICKKTYDDLHYTVEDLKYKLTHHYRNSHKNEHQEFLKDFDTSLEKYVDITELESTPAQTKKTINLAKKDSDDSGSDDESSESESNSCSSSSNNNNAINWKKIGKRKHLLVCSKNHELKFGKLNALANAFKKNHSHDKSDEQKLKQYKIDTKKKADLITFCPECKEPVSTSNRNYTIADVKRRLWFHYKNTHQKDYPLDDIENNPSKYIRISDKTNEELSSEEDVWQSTSKSSHTETTTTTTTSTNKKDKQQPTKTKQKSQKARTKKDESDNESEVEQNSDNEEVLSDNYSQEEDEDYSRFSDHESDNE